MAEAAAPHPVVELKKGNAIVNRKNVFGQWETVAATQHVGPPGYVDEPLPAIAGQSEEDWYSYSICIHDAPASQGSDFWNAVEAAVGVLSDLGAPLTRKTGSCSAGEAGVQLFPVDASGLRTVNEDHSIYLVTSRDSRQYEKIDDRMQQLAAAGHTGVQVGALTRYRGMLKGIGDPMTPNTQRATWQILVNGVDPLPGYALPETTQGYAGDNPGEIYVPEVVLHELMHVLGADHLPSSDVGYAPLGGNGGKVSSIMAEKLCTAGSTGYRGATAGASTAEHPVPEDEGTGALFLPQAELTFLDEHYGSEWFTPDPVHRTRVVSWYPLYDAGGDCVKYLALSEVEDIGILEAHPIGASHLDDPVIFGCPGKPINWHTNGSGNLGWHLPTVDRNQPEHGGLEASVVLRSFDGTLTLDGDNWVPSAAFSNSEQAIFSDVVGSSGVHVSVPLEPACTSTWCPREEEFERLYVVSGAALVPTNTFWDRPRACPSPGGPTGWPGYPCCPGGN